MKTACYLRYSSDMQREASIDDQLRNIENYCTRNNLPMPVIYKDQAISGARNDRPGYMQMLAAAEAKSFDILLLDDLDRMSRDNISNLTNIRNFKYLGIRIIGVSDGIDTSRDNSKVETGLRGLMGELYLDDLRKKTLRGLVGQSIKGNSTGGKTYGYDSIPNLQGDGFKKVINEEEAKWVRYIFERFAAGFSSRQIIHDLNEKGVKSTKGVSWAGGTIHPTVHGFGMLCNPIYIGKSIYNRHSWHKNPITGKKHMTLNPEEEWIHTNLPELRIIDDETWEKCQKIIRENARITKENAEQGKKSSGRRPSTHIGSGILKCGVCGGPYVIVNKDRYGCNYHKDRGNSVCTNSLQIKTSTIEGQLMNAIKKDLLSEEAYSAFSKRMIASLKAGIPDSSQIKKVIIDTQKEIDNLIKAIMNGIDSPSVKAALRDSEQKLKDAQRELKQFETYKPAEVLPAARKMFETMTASLANLDDIKAARESLRQLVGEIILRPDNGYLTAEVPASGLHVNMKIMEGAGTGYRHYLEQPRIYTCLR